MGGRHVFKCNRRVKDGKEHCWRMMENRRRGVGRAMQRPAFYLGEINDHQRQERIRSIEDFDVGRGRQESWRFLMALGLGRLPASTRFNWLSEFGLKRPGQMGSVLVITQVWEQLNLRALWQEHLGRSEEGTEWEHVLEVFAPLA